MTTLSVSSPSTVPSVSAVALVGEHHAVDPWLLESTRMLEIVPLAMARAVVAGRVLRYFHLLVIDAGESVRAIMAGDPGPRARVTAWAKALTAQQLEDIERQAALRVFESIEDFEEIRQRPSQLNAVTAARMVKSRDDLESMQTVLGLVGRCIEDLPRLDEIGQQFEEAGVAALPDEVIDQDPHLRNLLRLAMLEDF